MAVSPAHKTADKSTTPQGAKIFFKKFLFMPLQYRARNILFQWFFPKLGLDKSKDALAGRFHLLRLYPFAWGEEGGDPGLLQLNSLSWPIAFMS
jgi:hypothetical protein